MKIIDTERSAFTPDTRALNNRTQLGAFRPAPQLPPGDPEEHIALLVQQIEPPTRREPVQTIFEHLFHLLKCLRHIESNLRQADPTQDTLATFELFRSNAVSLLDFIRLHTMYADTPNQILDETLDGISFAVSHDLQRIFETELKTPIKTEPSDVSRGRFLHALGVLTNCLQQSVITLAQVFDPALDGSKLFDDSKLRLRQSLRLYRDLSGVVQLVRLYETRLDPQLATSILRRVDQFRNESLCFLMYKDWKEFENFSDKILTSMNDPAKLGSVLHLFLCYLEALLGQVKLRAALADVFCDFFEEELDGRTHEAGLSETDVRLNLEMFSLD